MTLPIMGWLFIQLKSFIFYMCFQSCFAVTVETQAVTLRGTLVTCISVPYVYNWGNQGMNGWPNLTELNRRQAQMLVWLHTHPARTPVLMGMDCSPDNAPRSFSWEEGANKHWRSGALGSWSPHSWDWAVRGDQPQPAWTVQQRFVLLLLVCSSQALCLLPWTLDTCTEHPVRWRRLISPSPQGLLLLQRPASS